MNEEKHDHAGVIAPPPVIVFGALAVGLVVNHILPIAFLPSGVNLIAGSVLIILGLLISFGAIVAMFRAGTSPEPHKPVKALVTNGPFRFTRNPIYLAFALIYLGVCAAFNALLALVLFPVAIVIIHLGVIAPEEKYLAQKFGDAYASYQARVRRWI